jgi:MSHA biogenesis protein MshO
MIVVIVLTGIIASAVAVFIRRPVEGYVGAARRAELSDIADTALRRMTRDLRSALPNSVRIIESPGGSGILYLEYLQTSGGGRYRAEVTGGGAGDILDFTNVAVPDTSFEVIGPPPTLAGGESIVVYNLGADPSVTTANAYYGDNRGRNATVAGQIVTFTPPESPPGTAVPFPFASPGKRFQVVQYPVTYECNPNAGAQTLRRYWGYTITLAQPTPPADGGSALLATNVTGCTFTYAEISQRAGLVALFLQVSRDGEGVRLFQEAHINNVP